jgi:ATP-dependent Clp protease protease subunit
MAGSRHARRSHPRQSRREEGEPESEGPIEIALVGELGDNEADLADRILGVPAGGACTLYFDSPGGSPYCAMALVALIRMRGIRATGIVVGECSSAALWPFAACERRIVTPYSVLLFHPMKWQSEEHIGITEAVEWSRHFGEMERDMDRLLALLFGVPPAVIDPWVKTHRYVTGGELAGAGLAELVDLAPLADPLPPARPPERPAGG